MNRHACIECQCFPCRCGADNYSVGTGQIAARRAEELAENKPVYSPLVSNRWFDALTTPTLTGVAVYKGVKVDELIEAARDLVRECEEHEAPSWNAVQRLKAALQ